MQTLVGRTTSENRRWGNINKINRSENSFCPKDTRNSGREEKRSSSVKDMTMLTLCNSVLLRSVRTGLLRHGPMREQDVA